MQAVVTYTTNFEGVAHDYILELELGGAAGLWRVKRGHLPNTFTLWDPELSTVRTSLNWLSAQLSMGGERALRDVLRRARDSASSPAEFVDDARIALREVLAKATSLLPPQMAEADKLAQQLDAWSISGGEANGAT